MRRIYAWVLLLAVLILGQTLVSCQSSQTPNSPGESNETTTQETASQSPAADPVVLGISGVKTSDTSALGEPESVFADDESVWKGLENNPTAHSFAMALETNAVITKIVVRTPVDEDDCNTLRAALLEGSTDGREWVELKAMGTMLSPDKVYNITVQNETPFGYFRLRQPDDNVSNAFAIRYVQLWGIPTDGPAPSVENIASESSGLQLLSMKAVSVYQTNTGDPSQIFQNNGSVWAGSQFLSVRHYVTATLETQSVITQIKMIIPNPIAGTNKMNGSTIEASVDGEHWTVLATIDSVIQAGATYVYNVDDPTAYSYLCIRQSEERLGSGFDVPNFLVFGKPTDADTVPFPENHISGEYIPVTTLSHTNQAGGDPQLVWGENSGQFWLGTMNENDQHYLIGELPNDMRITRIVYYNTNQFLSRSRGSQIQVSDDMENWTTIVTLPTDANDPLYPNNTIGYDAAGQYREYFLELDSPYRYIRVIQGSSLVGYYWTIGNINLYGVPADAQ